ncbi:Solute carrier family 35 member G1 [Araneus ventricosus]|uniref:Solute carrier family 35 member G1 n=1 Tax=Araneus ventricosus TaxID=182803 RepID=A0A4Y2Q5R5_ARAVE|nr:Solute carrier family 35 member G1 [Araneus ventricosus]
MFLKRKTFHLERTNVEIGEGSKLSIFKGLFLGLLSGISYSIVSVMVKEMTNLHPGQLAVCRFVALFFMSMPETVKTGQNPFGPRKSRWFILLRGIFGSTNIFLSFTAFRYLNLSEASAIIFSSPVFVTVFARIFLKEPCGTFQTLTVLVTVIGIIFATKLPSQLTENPVIYSSEKIYGLFAAITSAIFIGFETITIRKVKSVHETVMMFNFGWFAILASLLLTAVLGNFRWHYCGVQPVYILLIGLFSYAGQKMLVIALQSEFAGPVYTMRAASDISLSFLWQIFIFRDSPDSFGIVGAVLILLSVASVNLSKWFSHLPHDSNLLRKFEWIIA